jgi:hypothetical protein
MEKLGPQSRGALRENTGMQARKKLSRVSEHDAPKTEGKGTSSRKGHFPREDETAQASSSTVQRPIERSGDGSKVAPRVGSAAVKGNRPTRREDDPANATEGNTVPPIQRPDPDPEPIARRKPGPERGAGR